MTSHQKALLLSSMRAVGIHYREGSDDELAIVCPHCSRRSGNRRPTLYANVRTDKYICFRCEPRRAGRDLLSLVRMLGLKPLELVLSSAVPIADDSLIDIRRRLLDIEQEPTMKESNPELPAGFRTDWHQTILGSEIYKYLTRARKLTDDWLRRTGVGYCIQDPLSGCAVFPVVLNNELRFCQARRVLFGGEPKYVSHPAGVHKSQVLYGYDWLRPGSAVIVEGIFDCLALMAAGFPAVAILGKSISDAQIKLLAEKKINHAIVMLDGDARLASQQLARVLEQKLWTAKHVTRIQLAERKDPATLTQDEIKNCLDAPFAS